jgi:hypothetical protein
VVIGERRARRCLRVVCCALLIWVTSSCSSSKNATPVGFQFVSPTGTPTVDLGESLNLTVNQSATWTLQSGCLLGKPEGTFAGGATTATGSTATYVAPAPQSSPSCPEDVVVASASNQAATLTVDFAQQLTISNASALTYQGTGCTNNTPCCPPSGTLLVPPTENVTSLMEVNTYESLGALQATGGVPPYIWQVTSGTSTLPAGLQLTPGSNSSQTLITGSPTTAGCSTFTLQVSDSTAGANCNPQTSAACSQAVFNIVVVPNGPKVQVPSYPSAFNDPQNGNRGVPYPQTAMVAAGTVPPYFWCESPTTGEQGSTLPPGLELNSVQQTNFGCPSTISNSGVALLSGTTTAGNDQNQNDYCSSLGTGAGCYNTQFQVYDSQLPYPGMTFVTLKNMADLPMLSCSQANQAPLLNQGLLNPDSYLTGPVAFMLRGVDSNGPVVIAGSVTLDGSGNATGGTVDITRSTGHRQLTVQSNGSWYVVGGSAYGVGEFGLGGPNLFDYSRGCMNLALSDSAGSLPISFAFTLSGCTNHYTTSQVTSTSLVACGFNTSNQTLGTFSSGRIIEFDDNTGSGTRTTGVLRAQNSSSFSSGLSGPYAFGFSGGDSVQQRYAAAGSFQANSGTLSSVADDIDDGGTCGSNPTCNVTSAGGSGSLTADPTFGSSNGRWSGTLGLNSQTSLGLAVYAVSSGEALVATTNPLAVGQPILGGEAISTAASFNNSSLQNIHIFHIAGLASAGPDVSIGVLDFDGNGNLTGGTVYQDQAATLGTTQVSAEYQINSSTGRTVFTVPGQGQTLGAHNFVAYLIPPSPTLTRSSCSTPAACITGFLVGTDNTAQSGLLEFQTSATAPPPPFENLYLTGNYAYGTDEIEDALSPNLEGDVFASANSSGTTIGNLGGGANPFVQDVNYGDKSYFCPGSSTCYLLQPNQLLSGSYTITANGTGTFGGGVVSVSNGNVTFYIDESPVNTHPSVTVAEQ